MLHNLPDLRLMTRAARLYHEEGLNQTEVAHRLGITQVAVSRLLKKAEEHGIVRTTVLTPPGTFADLEGLLEGKFGLTQVTGGDASLDSEEFVLNAIGSAAAQFIESTLKAGEVIGISSWSESLLSMVETMPPPRKSENCFGVAAIRLPNNMQIAWPLDWRDWCTETLDFCPPRESWVRVVRPRFWL